MINKRKPKWINKLPDIVKESRCRSEVLEKLGLTTNGSGNHRIVKQWIANLNIDISHFDYRKVIKEKLKKYCRVNSYTPDQFLIENWNGSISPIKKWAKEHIEYKCAVCSNDGTHRNLPLSLQLDHINGNPKDNRKENIRWLCPNCHSQMETYGGKKLNLHRRKKSELNPMWRSDDRPNNRKVNRPSREELQKMIIEMPITHIGKKYGVSDNAVRKWIKRYNII